MLFPKKKKKKAIPWNLTKVNLNIKW
jgi:hypothetical protein